MRVPAHHARQADPFECGYSFVFLPFFLEALSLPFRFDGGELATRRPL